MEYIKSSMGKSVLAFTIIALFSFTACDRTAEEEESKTIKMAYANWTEGVAMTYLAAELLEERLGYEVVTKMTDVQSVFELLESGEYDVFVDAWLPNTHGQYMDQYGNEVEDLGVNVEQVQTGLLVPDYVEAQSISDLEGSMSKIIGIGSEAGITSSTRSAIEVYDLSLSLENGSEQSMTDSLINAIKRREPVVITGWTPHWVYNRYDLRFLEDPQNAYGDAEKIHTIARNNFTNEHSRAALFFERFQLTEEQLGELMNEIVTLPGSEERAVQNWINDNEFVVNQWVRGLEPEREKVM